MHIYDNVLKTVHKAYKTRQVKVCYVEDDDLDFINALQERFTRKNYAAFDVIRTTEDFISEFVTKHSRYDVLLLDRFVSGIDMISFLPHLKKNFPYMVVLLITSYADMTSMIKAKKLGATAFFCKNDLPLDILAKEVYVRAKIEIIELRKKEHFFLGDLSADVAPQCVTVDQINRAILVQEIKAFVKLFQHHGTVDAIAEASSMTPFQVRRRIRLCGLRPYMLSQKSRISEEHLNKAIKFVLKAPAQSIHKSSLSKFLERPEPKQRRKILYTDNPPKDDLPHKTAGRPREYMIVPLENAVSEGFLTEAEWLALQKKRGRPKKYINIPMDIYKAHMARKAQETPQNENGGAVSPKPASSSAVVSEPVQQDLFSDVQPTCAQDLTHKPNQPPTAEAASPVRGRIVIRRRAQEIQKTEDIQAHSA